MGGGEFDTFGVHDAFVHAAVDEEGAFFFGGVVVAVGADFGEGFAGPFDDGADSGRGGCTDAEVGDGGTGGEESGDGKSGEEAEGVHGCVSFIDEGGLDLGK